MIELLQQINALDDRIKELERQEFPFFTNSLSVGFGGTPNTTYKVDIFGALRAQTILASGGLTLPFLTSGSIPFIGANGLVTQDNANLSWDNATKILKIPTIRPVSDSALTISSLGSGATTGIELGANATGNRYAYIDFIGDDTNTDYALRIIRNNGGVNTTSQILHKGTGEFALIASDAGSIALYTSNTSRFSINSSGNITINQSLTVSSGINVGSAAGAGAGDIHMSGDLQVLTGGVLSQTLTTAVTDAATTTTVNALLQYHRSSGTPAAGFGVDDQVILHSSTNTDRGASLTRTTWATATDASRKARKQFFITDTAAREVLRFEASGSAAMIGFLGAGAVARPTVTGAKGGNAALTSLLTQLATLGLITDSTT